LWPYPDGKLGYVLAVLMALNVGVAVFLFVRGLDGVGYSITWGRNWGFIVAFSFLLFAAIAIPLGRTIGFLRLAPNYAQVRNLPVVAVGIFFFTAWPEEFLFRGILQNLISKSLKSEWSALIATSFLFGAAHLPNGVHFPHVNWRYGILATIAGFFYGWTWKKTGSIFPAALVHAAVDVAWHFLFTAP
jgi:membrane protease YdiL (CAAX protease family)